MSTLAAADVAEVAAVVAPKVSPQLLSFRDIYDAYEKQESKDFFKGRDNKFDENPSADQDVCAIRSFMKKFKKSNRANPTVDNIISPNVCTGFTRMERSRLALECMDRQGWER